ncbi:MAG: HNH endonuclease [Leisingera sp.]
MGKLKGRGFKSPLQASRGPRPVRASGGAAKAIGLQAKSAPWKKWYYTAKWRRLRDFVLKRDGYICQATGVPLVGDVNAWNSPIADHKIPHKGDPDLFWDPENVWSVSKRYHDREKQRLERSGLT